MDCIFPLIFEIVNKYLVFLISLKIPKHKTYSKPMGPKLIKGSYQCKIFKEGRKCELCTYMKDSV